MTQSHSTRSAPPEALRAEDPQDASDAANTAAPREELRRVSIEPQWSLRTPGGELLPRLLIDLLRAIGHRGSLLAASNATGTSYRHAWQVLRQGEAALGGPLLCSVRGRGSELTPIAQQLLGTDDRVEARFAAILRSFDDASAHAADAAPRATLRLHASYGPAIATLREAAGAAGLDIWFRDTPAAATLSALADGRCDVAGVCLPQAGLEQRLDTLFAEQGLDGPHWSLQLAVRHHESAPDGEACLLLWPEAMDRSSAVQALLSCVALPAFRASIERLAQHDARLCGSLRRLEAGTRDGDANAAPPEVSATPAARLDPLLSRRSVSPRRLAAPAPSPEELDLMLLAALRAPDHGNLHPWRVIEIRAAQRERLADFFEQEKQRRDPMATPLDLRRAREHALRPPMLLAFVVSPRDRDNVPRREQWLAAGAALGNLLNAAHLLGHGAIVLSGERCFDTQLQAQLGLSKEEALAGFVSIGHVADPPPAGRQRLSTQVWSCWMPEARP